MKPARLFVHAMWEMLFRNTNVVALSLIWPQVL